MNQVKIPKAMSIRRWHIIKVLGDNNGADWLTTRTISTMVPPEYAEATMKEVDNVYRQTAGLKRQKSAGSNSFGYKLNSKGIAIYAALDQIEQKPVGLGNGVKAGSGQKDLLGDTDTPQKRKYKKRKPEVMAAATPSPFKYFRWS